MAECCTCGLTDCYRYTKLNQNSGKEELVLKNKSANFLCFEFVKFDAICDHCIRKLDTAFQFIKKVITIQHHDQDTSTGFSTAADLEN